jgi:tetratricopeptide (TPR) repeat protein
LRLVDEMVGATAAADTREAELQARSWRVIDLWELGRLADVRTEVAAYEALADRVALPHYRWYVPLWRAGLAIVEGRWAAVEELAAEALRLGREADDPNAGLFVGIQRRVALVDQGRVGGIDRDEVLREASASAAPGAWLSWVANLDALAGRMDLARAALRRLVASGDWPAMDLNWHAACELSDSAALVGDRDAAAVLHERMAPHAHLFPVVARGITSHGCAEQYVGRLAAVLGRLDEAEARLREAVLANRRAGARPGAATSLVHLGGVLGARGDAAAAREALAEGRAEAEALDMAALAATAAAGLRDLDDAAPR